jgi:hypothetical protein
MLEEKAARRIGNGQRQGKFNVASNIGLGGDRLDSATLRHRASTAL